MDRVLQAAVRVFIFHLYPARELSAHYEVKKHVEHTVAANIIILVYDMGRGPFESCFRACNYTVVLRPYCCHLRARLRAMDGACVQLPITYIRISTLLL